MLEGVTEHIWVKDQQSDIGKHGHDGDEHHHPSSEKHSASDYYHGIADEYRTRGKGRTRHNRYQDSEKNGISTKQNVATIVSSFLLLANKPNKTLTTIQASVTELTWMW